MCGRYSLEARPDEIAEAFAVADEFAFSARYNIAPTQSAPVVRVDQESGSRRVVTIRWGLTSHPDNPRPLINARSETVGRKPSFRSAFRSRRCLVLKTGTEAFSQSQLQAVVPGKTVPSTIRYPGKSRIGSRSTLGRGGIEETRAISRNDPRGNIDICGAGQLDPP